MPRPRSKPSPPGARAAARKAPVLAVDRKPSQRERLVTAMKHVACREGYAQVTIADVVAEAGVSRQTFYECFADKEDCFLAAYRQAAGKILAPLRSAVLAGEWSQLPQRAVRALVEQIQADPQTAWLFLIEGMAGGTRVRAQRNEVLARFEADTDALLERARADGITLDVPPIALVGAVRELVASCLASNAVDRMAELEGALATWIAAYAVPTGATRWSISEAALLPAEPQARKPSPLLPRPQPLPRGRHTLPASVVARNRRERIIHATAEIAQQKGYAELGVTDIVAQAQIAKDVFYEHFNDKQAAFLAAQQFGFKDTFAACARAFFSKDTWPERMFHSLWLLTTLISKEPALAHLRTLEPFAAGPEAIERMQEMSSNFAVFIQDGYHYSPQAATLPQLCPDAIAGAIFEIIRRDLAEGRAAELPRRVPQLTYIAIAPFTGPVAAAELIEEMIGARVARTRDRTRRDGAGAPHVAASSAASSS